MSSIEVEYAGKDLEAMDFAENYHRWILEIFKPFVGKHLAEVGAGTGSFSRLLLETNPTSLDLIEPSEMFVELEKNLQTDLNSTNITFHRSIFTQIACEFELASSKPDTIFYVNVLEHIEDDRRELETVKRVLAAGGHVCIFVPAMPSLYSEFDKRLGHYRRYTKNELIDKCRSAGLEICVARYFDLLGILPWFAKYRVMRSLTLGSSLVRLYDNLFVPAMKPVENFVNPPVGKNLLIVAKKN
jgi:SAM-dependent methyltransferase